MSGAHDYKFNMLVFEPVGDDRVKMNGMTVLAEDIVLKYDTLVEGFNVTGLRYSYMVYLDPSGGKGSVQIAVRQPGIGLRSYILPTNQSELLEAIDTIARDFEDRLDMEEIPA